MILKQNEATNIMVFMVDSTDHVTGKAGLTLTIMASKNGGAFFSISPTVIERGNGWYSVGITTILSNTLGDLALYITAVGADPKALVYRVENLIQASSVWEYENRVLTPSPLNLISIEKEALSFVRGDSLYYEFTNVDLTDFSKIFFTVKKDYKDKDYESIIQVTDTEGLLYLNAWKKDDLTLASLTPVNNTVVLEVEAEAMNLVKYSDDDYFYDLQVLYTDGSVKTHEIGKFRIIRDTTNTIT